MTPEEGSAAARALHEERLRQGWRPLGRKIGFTNRTIWPRYGVYEPIWGTVYDRTVLHAKDDACRVPLAGLLQPRIEPEILFRLKAAPRSADKEELLSCLDWAAHSIEIVQCRQPGWKVTLADCAADNGLHGRLVVGTPVPVADLPELVLGSPLAAGEIVSTGTLTDAHPVAPGETWSTEIRGLPLQGLTLHFA